MVDMARGNILLRTVDELIDPATGQWDDALTRSIFNPIVATRILQIPLSENIEEDFVAWQKTKYFTFSVRSAYYSEWEHQYGGRIRRNDGQGPSRRNDVWDLLWKLKVPSKINFFVWLCLHGLIPGMGVLANRHIKVSAQCPICKQGPEDIRHLMFKCKQAKEVWRALGLYDFIKEGSCVERSGSVIMEEILKYPIRKSPVIGQLGLQETVAVGAWYIWWQRREAVNGGKVAPAACSAFSIHAITMNYGAAYGKATPKEISWEKPLPHQYKLNVDAAYFPSGVGAAAAVICNCRGEVIAGGSWSLHQSLDATSSEALALKHGLELLEGIGCAPTTVESDNLEIINICNGESDAWGALFCYSSRLFPDCSPYHQYFLQALSKRCKQSGAQLS